MNIQSLLSSKSFPEIQELIKADKSSFESLKSYEKENLIQNSLKSKAFGIIETLWSHQMYSLDLYELDKWYGSLIDKVLTQTPFETNPVSFSSNSAITEDRTALDPESLLFFEQFCEKIENIDETIENQTILEYAIQKKLPIPVLQIIADKGCSPNTMDNSENTLLFKKLQAPLVQWLISQGLDVNHKNKGQDTPLFRAIDNNSIDVAKILLDSGADTTMKNKDDKSVFNVALVDKVSYDMFDLLCEYDQPNLQEITKSGTSLLYDYIERLYSTTPIALEYIDKLIAQGGDIHQINTTMYGQKKTPLEAALKKGHSVFEILWNHNTENINITDNEGNTILHKVCAEPLNHDPNKAKELYKITKLLLQQGADPSIRNTEDKSPMDLAIQDNLKEKIVGLLIKN